MVMIINADHEKEAHEIAKANGAWPGYDIQELDTKTYGVVFKEGS